MAALDPPPTTFGQAVAALSAAQKPSYGAPAYSVLINRRAGRYLAAAAYRLNLTPNAVTGISSLFSYTAIACLAVLRPGVLTAVLVAGGLLIGYAFDSADGQLARLRGGGTRVGEWLDHIVDAVKINSLHLAVLISSYRFFEFARPAWLLVPIGYALVASVLFFGMILTDQLRRGYLAKPTPKPSERQWRRSIMVLPTDFGLLCLIFLLLGFRHLFFAVYTVMFVCNAAFTLLAIVKWRRDMQVVDELAAGPRTFEA